MTPLEIGLIVLLIAAWGWALSEYLPAITIRYRPEPPPAPPAHPSGETGSVPVSAAPLRRRRPTSNDSPVSELRARLREALRDDDHAAS